MNWYVKKKFRKYDGVYYELTNGSEVRTVFGYKNVLKFLGDFK